MWWNLWRGLRIQRASLPLENKQGGYLSLSTQQGNDFNAPATMSQNHSLDQLQVLGPTY